MNVQLTVNGKSVGRDVSPSMLLVDFIRDELRLTGTHIGCDTSQCGCCLVHIDGRATKSCTTFAWQADGADIVTIEGLGSQNNLHPMQQAFNEKHGLQCGYCTPGMIMSAVDMVYRLGPVSDPDVIRHEIEGNICRCTGYHNIVRAIQAGAAAMHQQKIDDVDGEAKERAGAGS